MEQIKVLMIDDNVNLIEMVKEYFKTKEDIKVLYVASECQPFIATGGLADVAGSLPKAIKKAGHDIKVVMPLYGCIDREKYNIEFIDFPVCFMDISLIYLPKHDTIYL